MIHQKILPTARSGASVGIDVDSDFSPSPETNWGWFNCVTREYNQLETRSATVRKINPDPRINQIEIEIAQAFRERGYDVPAITPISPTELDVEYIEGLTFGEEVFFDRELTPQRYVEKLREKYALARKMDRELESILTLEQEVFFREKERTARKDSPHPYYPLTSKVRKRIEEAGLSQKDAFYLPLMLAEELLKEYGTENKRWSLDAHGDNFVGNTRIDFNSLSYGPLNQFVILDTPPMFNLDFWMRRLHPENIGRVRYLETAREGLVREAAKEEGIDPDRKVFTYHLTRIFRNTLQMIHSYQDALKVLPSAERLGLGPLESVRLFQAVNRLFAHYDQADNGIRAMAEIAGIEQEIVRPLYQGIESMTREMMGRVMQDQPAMQSEFEQYAFIWPNYRDFKRNYPTFPSI